MKNIFSKLRKGSRPKTQDNLVSTDPVKMCFPTTSQVCLQDGPDQNHAVKPPQTHTNKEQFFFISHFLTTEFFTLRLQNLKNLIKANNFCFKLYKLRQILTLCEIIKHSS